MKNIAEEEEQEKKYMFISIFYILMIFMVIYIYVISNQNVYILFCLIIVISGFMVFPLRAAYSEFNKPKLRSDRRNDILASIYGSVLSLTTGSIIFFLNKDLIISPQLTNDNDIIKFFLCSLSIPLIILGLGIILITLIFTIKLPK